MCVSHCLIESFFFFNVQRLHEELYTLDPASFFVPSFLDAVSNTSEENFKSIIVRAAPGIYTFDMFKPQFCQMLIAEVYENFEFFYVCCVVLSSLSDSKTNTHCHHRLKIWRNGSIIRNPQ